jgi:UDP-glucose 4-epimerase
VSSTLVVGGTSFVGRHLLPRLAGTGGTAFATYGRSDPPAVANVTWIHTDLAAAPELPWPSRCDNVVYLAQSRAWRRFPESAGDVFAVNVRGAFRAIEYARSAGARRFVLASTGSVYGDGPAREIDPIDVTSPLQFYAAAKLSAELLLRAYASSLAVVVLRLFVPYGVGQDPDMLVPQLVERVRRGDPIHLDGEDGLSANPVAVDDVVSVIERCLALQHSVVMNVAGPEILTLREMATRIGALLGREPRFEHRCGSARQIVGVTDALSRTLGWSPEVRFAGGLRRWLIPTA